MPGSRRRYFNHQKVWFLMEFLTGSALGVHFWPHHFSSCSLFLRMSASSSATPAWLSNILTGGLTPCFGCLFVPTGDTTVRCEQLDMLQDWLSEFRKSTSSSSTANPEELVAFDVLCGDLNFDNCSSGKTRFAFCWCLPVLKRNRNVPDPCGF